MERETNSMQPLCRAGCGFYGNPATDGLCSVCFKESVKKKQQQPMSTPSGTFITRPINCEGDLKTSSSNDAKDNIIASENRERPERKNNDKDCNKKIRCLTCQKKVGFTGVECRCGGTFCGTHIYSDKHGCTFDYRGLGAEEIRRSNPVVAGEKIKKI